MSEPVFYADKEAVMSVKNTADTFDIAIGVRNKLERDGDVPLYTYPDPRVAELEAVLRECRDEILNCSWELPNKMDKAIAKIDEVLNEDR